MKKKLVAALFAAMLLVALPTMAFAADSPTGTGGSAASGNASASWTGAVNGTLSITDGTTNGLGTYTVSFSDGTTTGFGTMTLTFSGLDQYNGQSVNIVCNHSDDTTESWTKTVVNGSVSVQVSKLSTFTISLANGKAASSSATSPKTGVDMGLLAVGTGALVIVASGVYVAMRKQNQR